MPYIIAMGSPYSVLKNRPLSKKDLAPSEFMEIPKGLKLGIIDLEQANGIHKLVELAGNLTIKDKGVNTASLQRGDRFWIAPSEWDVSLLFGLGSVPLVNKSAKGIVLDVPYFPQTDNIAQPMRTCNTSSNAMCAKYLGAKISGDDEFWQYVNQQGDTTDHSAISRALTEVGISSTWRNDLGFDDLDESILIQQKPVVIGILHRGSLSAPSGGHMIVVIGKKGIDYVVNDPYGSVNDGYTGSVYNGKGAVYSRDMLVSRWLDSDNSKSHSGWGRLFY
jgi:Peptidase_C39 like family